MWQAAVKVTLPCGVMLQESEIPVELCLTSNVKTNRQATDKCVSAHAADNNHSAALATMHLPVCRLHLRCRT